VGKYLFLYLKTGGGHLAPAKAVAEKIKTKKRVDVDVLLVDGLSDSNSYVRKVIEDGYKNAINRAAWTFEFLYALHKINFVAKFTASIVSRFVRSGIEKQILETRPKKIVVFHFFLIKPVYEIIKTHNLAIPVITVVTDPFTAHPIWFQQQGQNYVVFSDILKDKCLARGINKNNLRVFPFVLDSKFSQKVSDFKKIRIRKNLGFEIDSKIILIMGGGDGMPRGKKILKKIIISNVDAEIAIVCGKNVKLYNKAMKLKNKFGIDNLKVFGYIDFVHSLVSISEVVITKCGASTSMEVLLMGKVPVINNYIWEQEKGNMEFVSG
jgi:1,2-diacylglycerol 3-beta-galactosyltransferase